MDKGKIKKWLGDHKEQIVMGALAIGALGVGCYIGKNYLGGSHHVDIPKFDDIPALPPGGKYGRIIDEDIFTDLAPQIEDIVLGEGVDEGFIERTYKMAFPKNGDESQGLYGVLKKVTVTIKDAGEWEVEE